jgi:Asp-tRNA(Asn)/Glu-tRNA(Gln) amidotransferase A subunit family amidase
MADTPWLDDACSLVDAYRAGELSPLEALDASIAAIEASELNAVCHTDFEAARQTAAASDVSLPFGGVPMGVKELDRVEGWPYNRASLVFAGNTSEFDHTVIRRLRAAGAVLAAQTNASEFGGINCTTTKIHGTTVSPWNRERTPGGSSGGTAASVSGGLLPLGTGGDGGGSIRIPAGFCGLFGLKTTYGRIPKGPHTEFEPLTAVIGCLSRSVRDTARYLDVTNGYDTHDPQSLPRVEGYEAGLGSLDLSGLRVAILPDLDGAARVRGDVADLVRSAGEELARVTGMKVVDASCRLPTGSMEWAMGNLTSLIADLGDLYPACEQDLTFEIMFGLNIAINSYDLRSAGAVESYRRQLNEEMANLLDQADLIVASSNPDVAFGAAGPMPTEIDGVDLTSELGLIPAMLNNGALTIPANLVGNPAVSIPVGTVDGLPVGMQVIAAHHAEALLLDASLAFERHRPWPKVAPSAPC